MSAAWDLVNEYHRRAAVYESYLSLPDEEKIEALKAELALVRGRMQGYGEKRDNYEKIENNGINER